MEDCIKCEMIDNITAKCNECVNGKEPSPNCADSAKTKDPDYEKTNIVIFRFGNKKIKIEENILSFNTYFMSLTYYSSYTFTLNINLISTTNNNRILSPEETAEATCTQIGMSYQKIYIGETLCTATISGITNKVKFDASLTLESRERVALALGVNSNSEKMKDQSLSDIKDEIKSAKTTEIIVDEVQKKYGWTNDGYSFILKSKNSINNTSGMESITLNIENEEISSNAECDFPKKDNSNLMDCIVKNNDLSGSFNISYPGVVDNQTMVFIFSPSNKLLSIEKKPEVKKLSKGAKIGIIIGAVVFIGICITLIILFKTGVLCKGSAAAKNKGYKIAPEKSLNIAPGEIKNDNQFDAIMIKNQNVNSMK